MNHFHRATKSVFDSIKDVEAAGIALSEVESRWNWNSVEDAQACLDAVEMQDTFMVVDRGEWVSPRFDVVRTPKVGDKVSYSFNGDYYPCGEIAKISDSMKLITTTDGKKFYRVKQTGVWKYQKTWGLVQGHHNEKNPHF